MPSDRIDIKNLEVIAEDTLDIFAEVSKEADDVLLASENLIYDPLVPSDPYTDQIVRYGDGPAESSVIMPSFAKAFGSIADPKYFKGSGDLMHAGGRSQFLKNPSEDEIRTFFSRADMKDGGVRTTKDGDGNLYMWNAKEGTHKQFHM